MCSIVLVVKVIKVENGEGGREASEVSKTSEVKAEAKVEDTTKGETVLVDEDLRKLFVGGLAQVSMPVQFLPLIQLHIRRPRMWT